MPVLTPADHATLIEGLRRPQAWPEPVDRVELIETHISSVLLAGAHACKVKKPVAFPFLDFSTPARRRHFCELELRLNRRTAPQLYLEVRPLLGALAAPRIGAPGEEGAGADVLEHAVWMRRFDPALTLDRLAEGDRLTPAQVDALARTIAALHAGADPAPADGPWGTPAVARRWLVDTLAGLRDDTHAPAERAALDELARWAEAEAARLAPRMQARLAAGRVRECHGDLHLGNAVLLDGVPVLFDALEFDPALRFIDVASDIAFMFMDLLDHDRPALAWRLLDRWFDASGDWDAAPLLRFYAVYRALVRARVAQLRAQQGGAVARRVRLRARVSAAHYAALARQLAWPGPPLLVVMTGLSGSGKSTVAAALAPLLGALRVRSDVERKRLAGLDPLTRGEAPLYAPAMTARTYERLQALAAQLLDAGLSVVVDAAALRADERRALAAVAQRRGLRAAVVACEAPDAVLAARVAQRERAGGDPSDATLAVLAQQQRWREPRAADEPPHLTLDTALPHERLVQACEGLAQQLRDG